jgi:hypothetical protein
MTAATLAATLAACGSTEPSYEYTTSEQQLIDDLRVTGYAEVDKRSDIELVEAGWVVCDTLNKPGNTINDAVETAANILDDSIELDASLEWVDAIVTMSIVHLCSQHDFWLEM